MLSNAPSRHPVARLWAVAVLVMTLLAAAAVFARPADAFTSVSSVRLNSVEARLLSRINSARVARGIPALRIAPGYTDVARRWSVKQATAQKMAHNPNMVSQLAASGGKDWRSIGENVGFGSDADSLFNAYWNSAPHRANILNPAFRYIGMGWVERPGGYGYNTQNFVSHYSTTYGLTRVPAYGGRADTHLVTQTASLASFEASSDQRVAAFASSGLGATAKYDAVTSGTDNALRMTVYERTIGSGGSAGMRLRVAEDLRNVKSLTIRVRASSATGRSVPIRIFAKTAFGTVVAIGYLTIASGTTRTATYTLPAAARGFRNEIIVDVTRTSLQKLSSSLSGRRAYLAVYDIRLNV